METLKISLTSFFSILLFFPGINFAQTKSSNLSKRAPANVVDTAIVGGTIVSMDKDRRIIEDGAIVIQKGKITKIGKRAEVMSKIRAKLTIDATGKVIVPGLINTHTHVPMTLFRGIADDLDLNDWLTKYIFPAEGKNVSEDFVRAGTRLGLAEFIRGGTTTYCDMYYFEDAIADETFKAGLRGVLGETVIDFPVADNKTFAEAIAYSEKFIKKWQKNTLITPAIAPHAPYTVSEEHLKQARKVADDLKAPLVIHLAEDRKELKFVADNKNGLRPIEYLDKIGLLNEKTIGAHVIYANEDEIEVLKKYGVGVAHCPQSNMKLAAGVAPIPQMLASGLAVGLGTDGAASNNDLSMWEEMDTAAKLHKVFSFDPKVVSALQAFEMATIGGAKALDLDDKIGSLETGKRADIVIVDFDGLHQTPFYNMYSHLVYATKSSDVRTVLVDGKLLMKDRKLLTLNETLIKQQANEYRDQVVKSLAN
jgi:5-methylthioadenosine/S-adenosylhomocysteine deaminase